MTRTVAMGLVLSAFLAPAAFAADAMGGKVQAELVSSLEEAVNKVVQLAEAIPAEKFAWRPAPGVRSVMEVVGHVSGGNYLFSKLLGNPNPAAGTDPEKETDKAKAIAALKASLEHLKKTELAVSDADLDKTADFFGRPATQRSLMVRAAGHAHEHLGQLIAYARSNGVKPPWS